MKHKLFFHFVILTLMLVSLPAQSVHAETIWTVDTLTDGNDTSCTDGDCTLREAIHVAADGDTIQFSITGTITLGSPITLGKNLIITGPGSSELSISGGDATRIFEISSGKTVSISDLTFTQGWSNSDGGAIVNLGTLFVTDSVFSSNTATNHGGAIKNSSVLEVTNSTFNHNQTGSGSFGGGIYNTSYGDLTVQNCTFFENSAEFGGGIDNENTTEILNSNFYSNTANSGGGAIYNSDTLIIFDSTISDNEANTGGGIATISATSVEITGSTLALNEASLGGGLYSNTTLTNIMNSTFYDNVAVSKGGAIYNYNQRLSLANCTLSDNSASTSQGAGIHNTNSGIINLTNTITANSTSGLDCANYATLGTNINNLAENGNCYAAFSDDPMLDSLEDNGGPTETMMLLTDSPAIDAGDDPNCPTTDQRGSTRPTLSHCDLGAYELGNNTPTDITISSASVSENKPAGTTVGTISSTDPDTIQTHTYSFCGGVDDAFFSLASNILKTAAVFDYETKDSYAICLRTNDGHEGVFDKALTINVTDGETVTETFQSVGVYDGWILESAENSNAGGSVDKTATTFNLGDNAQDKQYRAILHFNTTTLPNNAVITKATLKIKKQSLTGNNNPFTSFGGLKVDIRKPFFGPAVGLVVADFNAAAGASAVSTFGAAPVSNWYSAVLNTIGKANINKVGATQFRLRFLNGDNDDLTADYMKFFSGNYATANARPTLIIEYHIP